MEITGNDYVMISHVSYFEMRPRFDANLKSIWESAIVDVVENINNERIWLFFAENEEMETDDTGYELNEKGEGCFSIIASKLPIVDQIYAVIDSERKISSEVRLMQSGLWKYTLILPGTIEDNSFSKRIYEMVRATLMKGLHNDMESDFDQRPVQFYIG